MLGTVSGPGLLQAFDQALGVGGDAKQMRCLLKRVMRCVLRPDRRGTCGRT